MSLLALVDLLDIFKRQNKRVFTLKEAAFYWNESKPATAMRLLRGQRRGLLWRVRNLWINRRDSPSLEELALSLVSPSYVSFESALYRHGILSQSPLGGLTVAVRGRSGRLSTPLGFIQFIHLKPRLFFGFNEDRVAFPEKAYLDAFYVRWRRGEKGIFSETLDYTGLNGKHLRQWAAAFPVAMRRIALQNALQ